MSSLNPSSNHHNDKKARHPLRKFKNGFSKTIKMQYPKRKPAGISYETMEFDVSISVKRSTDAANTAKELDKSKTTDPGNHAVVCRAVCRYNPNNYLEVPVPADTFTAPTQQEADVLAREFGESMAASMLDCTVEVTLKLVNHQGVSASVYLTDADGNETGPYYLSGGSNGSAWLEDGASYSYRANFYHPTNYHQEQTGSFDASQGHEESITVLPPQP